MTRRLPNDYERCITWGCPLADRFLRKQPGHPTYQAFSVFPGGEDCNGFEGDEK